jgi:hypothetical protein
MLHTLLFVLLSVLVCLSIMLIGFACTTNLFLFVLFILFILFIRIFRYLIFPHSRAVLMFIVEAAMS